MRTRVLLLLAVLTSLVSFGCSRETPDAVFLIVVDTLRPDRLSAYGREFYNTPTTDTLAAEGVLFENAFSVASWTIPSMGAMMTSLYPTQLGLVEKPAPPKTPFGWRQRREQLGHTLAYEERTLAEIMQEAGFTTAAFVNQPGLNASDGFAQGFDDYYYPLDVDSITRLDPEHSLEYVKWPPFLQQAREIDARLIEEFQGWLDEHAGEKMFVWVHLLTPHGPYLPPPWATRRVASAHKRFAIPGPTDKYDGEVIVADELVGRIIHSIDQRIGAANSVVVFTSDHGEAIGEHGMFDHGHTLHAEVVRVPLIIRAPQVPAGRRVDATVRTIDVLPTILDLVGESNAASKTLRGESLTSLFASDGPNRDVYSEAMLYGPTERALLVGAKKVMQNEQGGTVALFNWRLDPGETVNVKASHAAEVDSLLARLEAMHQELERDFERRAGSGMTREDAEQFHKAMESLGYIDVGDSIATNPRITEPPVEHDHD